MTPPKNETRKQRRERVDKNNAKRHKEVLKEMPKERPKEKRKRRSRKNTSKSPEEPEIRLTEVGELKQESKETAEEQDGRMKRKKKRNPEKERFRYLVRKITMTDEEKERRRTNSFIRYHATKERYNSEEHKKRKLELHLRWKDSLTGEKKERHAESVQRAMKNYAKKKYERIKKIPGEWEKLLRYQRERFQKQTPEEALRHSRMCKLNVSKRKLKKKLEEENVSSADIEIQLIQLSEQMWREFYPEGDVPMPGTLKRGPKKKQVQLRDIPADKLGNPSFPEHPPATLEKPVIHCKLKKYSGTADDSYPESHIADESESLTPLPSPPPSPPIDMLEEEEDEDFLTPSTEMLPSLPCPHCPFSFPFDDQLRSHIFCCHSENCWKCPKCQVVVLSSLELSQHYTSSHKRNTETTSCPHITTEPRDLWHYLCLKCPPGRLERFRTRSELHSHVENLHSSYFYPCQGCRLLKYSEHTLRVHQNLCKFVIRPQNQDVDSL